MSRNTTVSDDFAHGIPSPYGLEGQGIEPSGRVYWNLPSAELCEQAILRREGRLSSNGALVVVTSPHTGRSPRDRYIVRDDYSEQTVDWGEHNSPLSPSHFDALRVDVIEHLRERDLFVQDARAGEDPAAGISVRVVTPSAWHAMFARNLLLRLAPGEPLRAEPKATVLHAPEMAADPSRHGTRSGTFIALNLERREVLIGGTRYGGEIKKSVFSILNYLLPDRGVLPMHCSANVGNDGDVALFFGLSGTGKTTLSADPERGLIGDDEHGWGPGGVFNFEGGCYAKVIRLSAEDEPEIHEATQRFGTILENVVLDPATGAPDFADGSITENTRAAYPIRYIRSSIVPGVGGQPEHIVFLTCDAFGVLPPISRLSSSGAMYHFLSGYTAKVAGTEEGVTQPEATFSACFGAPFLPRRPTEYARLLGERLHQHGTKVWLVNTGWSGGRFGVGSRIRLPLTRAMVRAALEGKLDDVETVQDPYFGVRVPNRVPGVPPEILRPRETWEDPDEYDAAASELSSMFQKNFGAFRGLTSAEVANAGPA